MAADLSLAAPPPHLGARPKFDSSAVLPIFAVTVLMCSSFGVVFDLVLVVVCRMLGAPEGVTLAAGILGAVIALGLSLWFAYDVWRLERETAPYQG
ncbi:hypothetical protein L2D14_15320 [Thalassospiraceae bacterium LMO-JJ14]|nr:hypothetical protein L2D14_15320 [Thalassospiraceae bacterium LMO-JJ14]